MSELTGVRWAVRDAARRSTRDASGTSKWQHVKSLPSTMLEEQWIFRYMGRVPAISLRRVISDGSRISGIKHVWTATLLELGGVSALPWSPPDQPCHLEEAQAQAVIKLQQMGWEVSDV